MNKPTRIAALSMILVAAVAGTALATTRPLDFQGLETLRHGMVDPGNSSSAVEVGPATGVLSFEFERGRIELGAPRPTKAVDPASRHFQSDDTRLFPPAELVCGLSPAFAAGPGATAARRDGFPAGAVC